MSEGGRAALLTSPRSLLLIKGGVWGMAVSACVLTLFSGTCIAPLPVKWGLLNGPPC